MHTPFADPRVDAVFQHYPEGIRGQLLALRQLIFDTAAATDGVGKLQETLKWGQPSYLTAESGSGSTIRIDRARSDRNRVAIYVHCQTTLISTFRQLYADEFTYEGNRALLLHERAELPVEALQHCIALALTYHLRKRSRRP